MRRGDGLRALSNSVTVKEAQPEARKLGITWQPRRAVNPAQWPDACDLLGEKEIKAFLPQATNFRRTAEWVTVGEAGALGPGGAGRAGNGKCTHEVKLPSPSGRPFGNGLSIGIDAVGDPALVTRFFNGTGRGPRARPSLRIWTPRAPTRASGAAPPRTTCPPSPAAGGR
ncbi:hypothetical protein [Actinomadura kijaniata]|uniref:hypothetical protein n=1 Tax=Actinomadura kijaniata TaxID=46161 RepID=UPI000AFB4E71|nr:hypothetical protein [Actinomadura kijaniata]